MGKISLSIVHLKECVPEYGVSLDTSEVVLHLHCDIIEGASWPKLSLFSEVGVQHFHTVRCSNIQVCSRVTRRPSGLVAFGADSGLHKSCGTSAVCTTRLSKEAHVARSPSADIQATDILEAKC